MSDSLFKVFLTNIQNIYLNFSTSNNLMLYAASQKKWSLVYISM